MKIAALDLGSNTFLMLVAVIHEGVVKRVIADEAEITRLGQGIHKNKIFHKEALARADRCLEKYASIIRDHAVDESGCCGYKCGQEREG